MVYWGRTKCTHKRMTKLPNALPWELDDGVDASPARGSMNRNSVVNPVVQWSGNSWWQSKPYLSPLKTPIWLELHICWLPNVTQSCLIRLVMTSLPSFQSAFCLCYLLQSSHSTWWWARMGCWSSLTKKREGIFSEMRSELSTVCNGTYPSLGRWKS